jgi:hypothetical protein
MYLGPQSPSQGDGRLRRFPRFGEDHKAYCLVSASFANRTLHSGDREPYKIDCYLAYPSLEPG